MMKQVRQADLVQRFAYRPVNTIPATAHKTALLNRAWVICPFDTGSQGNGPFNGFDHLGNANGGGQHRQLAAAFIATTGRDQLCRAKSLDDFGHSRLCQLGVMGYLGTG